MTQDFFNELALEEARRILDNDVDLTIEDIKDILETEVENLFMSLSKEEKREIDIDEALDYAIQTIQEEENDFT